MRKTIRHMAAVIAAVSVMATAGISVSAATASDVVGAARSAGFLEIYVQQLDNYLKVNKFTSHQYDVMIQKLGNVESIGDDVAMKYFGKTLAEMRGQGGSGNTEGTDSTGGTQGTSGTSNGDLSEILPNDNVAQQITDKMSDEEMLQAINEIVDAGKEVGVDISVDKVASKVYTLTVRDKDGNIQMVTTLGKAVDKTGAEIPQSSENHAVPAAAALVIAVAGAGAYCLSRKNRVAE